MLDVIGVTWPSELVPCELGELVSSRRKSHRDEDGRADSRLSPAPCGARVQFRPFKEAAL
jgi:hypothetical protein